MNSSSDFILILKKKYNDDERSEIQFYFDNLSPDIIISGLRFAYNRSTAITGGYLFPGRKSLIKKETHSISKTQAQWRLDNWKSMIKNYREKGYSYPTISRIKKELKKIASC